MTRVAAFDVDGTLTVRDCVVPFLRQTAGTAPLVGRMLRHPVQLVSAGWRRDRDALKAACAMAAFSGRRVDGLTMLAQGFAQSVYSNGLHPKVVARLNEHLETGDKVVFVSASFAVYLDPLARLVGVDTILATRLQVGADGVLTGALDGPNCRGSEKVKRLHAWLDQEHGGRGSVHLTAYGDSPGDRELLADADVAHWVTDGSIGR